MAKNQVALDVEAEEVDQLLNACTTATAMIVRALVGVAVILPVITVKKIATITLSCNIWKNLKESYNRVTILKAKINGPMEESEDSSREIINKNVFEKLVKFEIFFK